MTLHRTIIPTTCCAKAIEVVPVRLCGSGGVFIGAWQYGYCDRCQTIYTRRKKR